MQVPFSYLEPCRFLSFFFDVLLDEMTAAAALLWNRNKTDGDQASAMNLHFIWLWKLGKEELKVKYWGRGPEVM